MLKVGKRPREHVFGEPSAPKQCKMFIPQPPPARGKRSRAECDDYESFKRRGPNPEGGQGARYYDRSSAGTFGVTPGCSEVTFGNKRMYTEKEVQAMLRDQEAKIQAKYDRLLEERLHELNQQWLQYHEETIHKQMETSEFNDYFG